MLKEIKTDPIEMAKLKERLRREFLKRFQNNLQRKRSRTKIK